MFLLSIFIFREGMVRMFHPWTEKLPLSSLQRKGRKFDCNGRLEQFGCAGYWFLSCIYSILVLGNVKYLERDGKVDMLKTVWHDWVFIFVKVFTSSIKLFCFTFLYSIDVMSLKCGRFTYLKYQFFNLTPDAVSSVLGSSGMLIYPQVFAPFFTNKTVVRVRNCLYCTVKHMDQTPFLAQYSTSHGHPLVMSQKVPQFPSWFLWEL